MELNRLLSYLPELHAEIREFQEITHTEQSEFDLLNRSIKQLFDEQFVLTASEQYLARREKMLNIQADPAKESLDFRRKRLINRYSTKAPFTERYLQQQLDRLVGAGVAIVGVDVQNYLLSVEAKINDAAVFEEVIHTVEKVKPANMVYIQQTAVHDSIHLEERISRAALTRMTGLSTTWQLGVTPFAVRGEEVQVK
ncbi:putative phage tail protein [Brevibacillus parabrevis]|uniref:putative phage tail protein n=1 Tax=Brevibacillus parabrevis TaxID=54914 RepID=UPI00248F7A77|nr:putative phage tail protein [Brevibacillus parabrevis]